MHYTVAVGGVNVSVSQLNIITTVDKTLDYGSFVVRNNVENSFDVGTSVDIDVTDGIETYNYHFIVQADDVQTIKGNVYIHSIDIIELTKILEWHTESVRAFTQVIGGLTLSLFDIVTRLQLSIPFERSEDADSTRIFSIDTDLANILRNVEAPEFVFANKNLKEILMEVFDFIGALPRLTKVSNNVVLIADFYNRRRNQITEDAFSRMERFNINEFGTALDADLKNLFDSYTEVVDPGPGQFKRLYAEGGDFSQENLVLKTDYPIIDIVSLKIKTDILPKGIRNVNNPNAVIINDVIIDLTPCVLERGLWENLLNAGFNGNFEKSIFRDNSLFFNRFSPDITNLYDVVGAFANAPIIAGTERLEAVVQRALELSDLTYDVSGTPTKLRFGAISNYAEIEFQIVYKAQIDSRTEVKRLDTRRIKFESQSYTGQIDNVVRADRVLDKLFKTQQLLGNAEIMTSERVLVLDNLYELGDFTNNDYILTTAEYQFDKNFITAKYMWHQNYQKVSQFIGLNSAIRLFPIPTDTYQRNVYIEDVIEIGTTLVGNDSDVTNTGLRVFLNTINNSPSNDFNKPITNIAFDNPSVPSYNTEDDIIVKPVSAYAGGNSINFHFEFDNPSIAGWQIDVDSQSGTQVLDFGDINAEDPDAPTFFNVVGSFIRAGWELFLKTDTVGTSTAVSLKVAEEAEITGNTITTIFKKPIVNGIYYVDDNGFVGTFSFNLINGYTTSNAGNLPIVAKSDLGTKIVTGENYLVFKDAREELAMTYAVHVLPAPTFEKKFVVGKYLIERNNLLKAITIANNQFEVFTATKPYDVTENQFSRSTDVVSAVTYSILGTQNNSLTLSQDITAVVWGIRKKITHELVIAVNQQGTVIRTIFFNARDRKSGVTYSTQTVTIPPAVRRVASFQVVAPSPTSTVINLSWTDTNTPTAADDFEFGFSIDLVNFTSQVVATNTVQVTALEPQTTFTFRVRARIGTEFSEYVYVDGRTAATPPPVAANLTAILLSERRILLRWDEVENVFLYRIEISESNTFSPLISGGLQQAFTNNYIIDSFNTSGIDFDTQYFIRLRALRDGVFGDYTNAVSVTTSESPVTSAPTITNITVSGSNVTFTLVNTDNRIVSMFADFVAATTSRPPQLRPNEAGTFTVAFSGSDSTIFAKATTPGKADSPVVSIQFAADEAPAAPSIGASAIVVNPAFNVVNYTYESTDPLVNGFVVERNPDAFNNSGFGEVSQQLTPLTRRFIDNVRVLSGQSYTYRVKAFNRVGTSTSNERTVTSVATVPNAPSSLAAGAVLAGAAGEGFFVLTWTRNSTDEDGFLVERRIGGAGAFAVVGGTSKGQTTIDQTIVGDPNTTYNYRVIAFNQFGNSTASNTVNVLVE